jgi:hypothetical protein
MSISAGTPARGFVGESEHAAMDNHNTPNNARNAIAVLGENITSQLTP